jgi:aconitate hydratase
MIALNLAKKIIVSHLDSANTPPPGKEIRVKIDQTLTHDLTGVMAYLAFEALGIPRVKTDLSVSYLDHNLLYIDSRAPDDHVFLRTIAQKYGIILSRAGNGICHTVHLSRFSRPGASLLGSDSHTPTCGAVGMLAIGAGGMDVGMAMAGRPYRLVMPEIVEVRLTGRLNAPASAKDVALEMLRLVGVRGGLGKIFEYTGDGATTLDIFERATITNMGAEMGATSSIFSADDVVMRFFASQHRVDDFINLTPDRGCEYDGLIEIDLSSIEPLVALPHMPDNVVALKDARRERIHQVYIGSCTNSSCADIKKAAAILKGRRVHDDVSLTVSASSRQIFRELLRDGTIADLVDAGARITEISCGACNGAGQAPPSGGASVRTSNRNFKGRGGASDARIYLVSPEVAAATAVTGLLTDPRVIMDDISVLSEIREPEVFFTDDGMLIQPDENGANVSVIRGPNIKPLPINSPLPEYFCAPVSLKAGNNVSTDDIVPGGADFASMRSNIPAISKFTFLRYDPDFAARAAEMKKSFIVGGENYGQGSSREHAALSPMFLGIKAVLAKSFARIHRKNLVNHGVAPLIFQNPEDYEKISLGDKLEIKDFASQMKSGKVVLTNITQGTSLTAASELSEEDTDILLAGGLLPYVRNLMGKS